MIDMSKSVNSVAHFTKFKVNCRKLTTFWFIAPRHNRQRAIVAVARKIRIFAHKTHQLSIHVYHVHLLKRVVDGYWSICLIERCICDDDVIMLIVCICKIKCSNDTLQYRNNISKLHFNAVYCSFAHQMNPRPMEICHWISCNLTRFYENISDCHLQLYLQHVSQHHYLQNIHLLHLRTTH